MNVLKPIDLVVLPPRSVETNFSSSEEIMNQTHQIIFNIVFLISVFPKKNNIVPHDGTKGKIWEVDA